MSTQYTIGNLAREFGVTTRTIRFYEDEGLLFPSRCGRNRVYGSRDRVRLKLILRGKRLGFSLGEVRELLDLYDGPGGQASQLESFLVKIGDHRRTLESQRSDIDTVLGEMRTLEQRCRKILGRAHAIRD